MDDLVAPAGVKIRRGMEHRDGKGNLIYAEWTRTNDMAIEYDKWRSAWCNKNRTAKSPEGLREGNITVEILEFAISKGYEPIFTINQLVNILNTEA
jgi:hypothetical protein